MRLFFWRNPTSQALTSKSEKKKKEEVQSTKKKKNESFSDMEDEKVYTGEELLNMNIESLPCLVENLLPKTGVVALVGSSDTGKSSLLRQLGCSIATKENDFLGFKITAVHNKVIYVSTEDDDQATGYLLKKQYGSDDPKNFRNIRYIFHTHRLVERLDNSLQQEAADCVIIDAFADLFTKGLNANNEVRTYLNEYRRLSMKHNCLIIFLHHTGKRTDMLAPSKDHVIGSQGFEGKMRLVLELRKDNKDYSKRHLCIVKGNYIPEEEKNKSYVLEFDQHMKFQNTNDRVSFSELSKFDPKKQEAKQLAKQFKGGGDSVRLISEKLREKGFDVGKSAVAEWLKSCPDVLHAIDNVDGQSDNHKN